MNAKFIKRVKNDLPGLDPAYLGDILFATLSLLEALNAEVEALKNGVTLSSSIAEEIFLRAQE